MSSVTMLKHNIILQNVLSDIKQILFKSSEIAGSDDFAWTSFTLVDMST